MDDVAEQLSKDGSNEDDNLDTFNSKLYYTFYTYLPQNTSYLNWIIEWYMNTVLSSGQPNSIFSFAKENNFEEAEFYKHFSSFE